MTTPPRPALLALVFLVLAPAGAAGIPAQGEVPMSAEAFRRLSTEDPRAALARGEELLAAGERAGPVPWRREIVARMARSANLLGDFVRSEEMADRLARLGDEHGDPVATALAGFARAANRADTGRVSEALEIATAAAARLTATGDPEPAAVAAAELCDITVRSDRTDLAERHCAEALRRWTALGDAFQVGRAENYLSSVARNQERLDEAIALATQARATFERADLPALARMMDDNLAGMLLDRGAPGDAAEALALSRRALAHELATGKRQHAVLSRLNLARAHSALGEHDEALSLVAAAISEAEAIPYEVALPDLFRGQLAIAEAAGRWGLLAESARRAVGAIERAASAERERALAEAETRYRALEREREIERLEQRRALDEIQLRAAREALQRQRLVLWSTAAAGASLLAAMVLLVLLLRAGRQRERELDHLSRTDSLTGAATRRAFFAELEAAFAERTGRGTPATLAVLDADGFKPLNDRHGHPAGDRVLASLVARIRGAVREHDRIGRLGGEEFGILLPGLGGEEAPHRAEAIREAIARAPHPTGAGAVPLTASLGVAVLDPALHPSVDRWLSAADTALYEAKRAGRNRVVIATSPPSSPIDSGPPPA